MSRRYAAPVTRYNFVVLEQTVDLVQQVLLQTSESEFMRNKNKQRMGRVKKCLEIYEGNGEHLHGSVHLTAIEHQEEEVQVVQRRLPRHVIPLILQVLGGFKGLYCSDDLSSLGNGGGRNNLLQFSQ